MVHSLFFLVESGNIFSQQTQHEFEVVGQVDLECPVSVEHFRVRPHL